MTEPLSRKRRGATGIKQKGFELKLNVFPRIVTVLIGLLIPKGIILGTYKDVLDLGFDFDLDLDSPPS